MSIAENYIEYKNHVSALENDAHYKKQVLRIQQIVHQRQLVSCMNDSTWIKLLDAINSLDFPPAFMAKLLKDPIDQHAETQFLNTVPWYCGDWRPFYQEGMPIFISIEYLIVKPMLIEHQGRLIAAKILDQTDRFRNLLKSLNVMYQEYESNGGFKIYGYR
ncbi:DUF6678 family protein [Acinetobacter nematophilus]|uniref:Uncharacterized protein n=1 Tax=Acinetobacter nematophilus TaxID=2994642 RepID=A0A9X3DUA7_9GAMM|nr:hypothetical protein [Acinetobacter nematophilus]